MTAARVLFPLMLIILAGLMFVTLTMPRAIPNALPGHMEHSEALMIRECAQEPSNLLEIWVNSSGERLNCLIMTPEGVADYILQFSCRRMVWLEISAFVFKQPTLGEVIRVLRAKGCEPVWP